MRVRLPCWLMVSVIVPNILAPRSGHAQLPSPPAEQCTNTRAVGSAASWLARADTAIGLAAARASGQVLRYRTSTYGNWAYQSDRMYEPYLFSVGQTMEWLSPATGALGIATRPPAAGAPPHDISLASGSYGVQHDTLHAIVGDFTSARRNLNPWATLTDWLTGPPVNVAQRCVYREFPRVVLTRRGALGAERLYVDEKTAFPVKLARTEMHYLWGPQPIEYVYTTWAQNARGAGYFPNGAYRYLEGAVDIASMLAGSPALISRDSAPDLAVTDTSVGARLRLPLFLRALPVDTIRVSPSTYLLKNYGYTTAVTFAHDTVFVLDAAQGEERARSDSAWIGKLYPGRHPVVLVVTDLAWPHMAGMRYWIATGATVASHETSMDFIHRVASSRWSAAPDLLEKRRAIVKPKYLAVKDSLSLGGGAVKLYPINGVASEGALMAYMSADRFLWASDFIQGLGQPTLYVTEVWRAANRVGIHPESAAAEHQALSPWSAIETAATNGIRAGTGNPP